MADNSFAKLDSFLMGEGKAHGSGAGLLPTPVSPAWFDAENRKWYGEKDLSGLKKKDKERLASCALFVQYSTTNRASCRRCGEKIEKDVLRLGYPFRWRESEDAYTLYLHPECYVPEVFGIKEKELHKKILGYSALSNTEKTKLWKAMRSSGRAKEASTEGQKAAEAYSTGGFGPGAGSTVPQVKVPKEITQPMLPFQKEGLSWMCHQEDTGECGGVLADEMGMGKTIQAISLLVARRRQGPCLVVCPMAAVHQWVQEIERFTTKGSLRVMVYHGTHKAKTASEFKKSDVVVTTYQTLETDYRNETNKQRVACRWCGKNFLPEKLAFHQKYFCGPTAMRTLKQQKTDKKHKDAAKKAMSSMGIGQASSSSSSSSSAPPTITNIYKDYMRQAGMDIQAKGYWNVMREANQRATGSGAASSSSSGPPPGKAAGETLNRERLSLLDRKELQELCEKRSLDTSGRKGDLIDRLMDVVVKGMALNPRKGSASPDTGNGGAKRQLSTGLLAKAKAAMAKAKAKAKAAGKSVKGAPQMGLLMRNGSGSSKYAGVTLHKQSGKWQASFGGVYLGLFGSELTAARKVRDAAQQAAAGNTFAKPSSSKGKKDVQAPKCVANNGYARTAASVRAQRDTSGGIKGKAASAGAKGISSFAKGAKRKHEAEEEVPPPPASYVTYEGVQLDLSASPLHAITWSRIILDEAHRIKGRTNSTALAAYALKSDGCKWCLTGTPLQNRVGELYSLIRFLRVRPYAFYYCKKKGCMCECATFMRERYCPNCGHVRFMHYSCFKSKVSNPIIKYGYMGAGKEAFRALRDDILNKVMLRRTKEERKADLHLPPIKTIIRKDKLSKQEEDFYSSLYMQSCVRFDTYVQGGTILHNYAHIFDLLTSLRRAVDHPYLIVYGGGQTSHALPDGKRLMPKIKDVCGLCQDDIDESAADEQPKRVAKCGHAFHDDCIRQYITDAPALKSGGVGCPVCFARLSVDLDEGGAGSDEEEGANSASGKGKKRPGSPPATASVTPKRPRAALGSSAGETPAKVSAPVARSTKGAGKGATAALALPASAAPNGSSSKREPKKGIMNKVSASQFQSSTKIEALVDEVKKMMRGDPAAKAIAFSQFGAMLELVEFRLKREGISCIVFRGGMTMQARDDALTAFRTDPSLRVILISLKAGGEGLNLQVANHVFLLDPWWNPACELQAIQRAHRIGQTREVKAVRFITSGTIEEKIVQLQEKKQLVFDAAIDASASSIAKLTEQDLRFLFQH